jgi:hypothetical protein
MTFLKEKFFSIWTQTPLPLRLMSLQFRAHPIAAPDTRILTRLSALATLPLTKTAVSGAEPNAPAKAEDKHPN